MKKLYASAALLLAAIIWGFAFVAQTVGMDHVGPFTFQSSRYLLADPGALYPPLGQPQEEGGHLS